MTSGTSPATKPEAGGSEHCPHGLTAEDVATNAAAAAEMMGTHVGTCMCCGGPSPKRRVSTPEGQPLEWVEFPYCGTCNAAASYAEQLIRFVAGRMCAGDEQDDLEVLDWLQGQAARSRAEGVEL